MTSVADPHFVKPTQLCIGLYIHLDMPWMDHPFTFPSFKIKTLDEIAIVQSLGLKRIRYVPTKSDCKPLPAPSRSGSATPEIQAEPVPLIEDDSAYIAKQLRIERLKQQRAKVAVCEREFLATTRKMKAIRQNFFANVYRAGEQATEMITELSSSMLVEADLTVHLVSDKVAGEAAYNHSLNVALLSMMVGKELGLAHHDVQMLGLGGLLHDIGNVDIPDAVKNKKDTLTKSESALMRQHCAYGVALGKKIDLPPEVLLIIAQHHERTDGSGYPMQLQSAQLSPLSRVVAVVEAYDELCNPVNPAKACTPHQALSIIYAQQRTRFDAKAITTFVRCLGVYPPGTLVMLSNGALGMVTSVNSARPLKPTVMVYDSSTPKGDAILVDLEHEPDVTIIKTLKPLELPQDAYDFLSPGKRMSYFYTADFDIRGAVNAPPSSA